jgi:hypothetical protein
LLLAPASATAATPKPCGRTQEKLDQLTAKKVAFDLASLYIGFNQGWGLVDS